MPVGFTGCQTSGDHQAHNFYRLNNCILWKIPANVINCYGYWKEEQSSFQMIYDFLNSDELFVRYVQVSDFVQKVHNIWLIPKVLRFSVMSSSCLMLNNSTDYSCCT